jgi:hypothetical protein
MYPMQYVQYNAVQLNFVILTHHSLLQYSIHTSTFTSPQGTFVANDILDPTTTSLWCAGKEFQRDQKVSHRLGTNEKTKVIAKFQQMGSGPPGRELVVNEEERKAMMAHYFKRQEEVKRLAEADEIDYLDSQWADSKEMKNNLQGLGGGIRAPGLRFS